MNERVCSGLNPEVFPKYRRSLETASIQTEIASASSGVLERVVIIVMAENAPAANYDDATERARDRARRFCKRLFSACRYENTPANFYQGLSKPQPGLRQLWRPDPSRNDADEFTTKYTKHTKARTCNRMRFRSSLLIRGVWRLGSGVWRLASGVWPPHFSFPLNSQPSTLNFFNGGPAQGKWGAIRSEMGCMPT